MQKSIAKKEFGTWAIVTGASSGIGEEFARQLAAKKINLVLVARRLDKLQQLGEALKKLHHIDVQTIQVDLSQPQAYQQIIDKTADHDIGLLVSNAGTGRPGKFIDRSDNDLSEIINVNALSHFWLSRHFSRIFVQKGRGGILLNGAMGSTKGVPYMAVESGSKAFLEGFSKALNWELQHTGVHVTILVTPPTETKVLGELGFKKNDMPAKPISVKQCVEAGLMALEKNQPAVIPSAFFRMMYALAPESMNRSKMGNILKKNNQFV